MTRRELHREAAEVVHEVVVRPSMAPSTDGAIDSDAPSQRFERLAAWARARGARVDGVTLDCRGDVRGLSLVADARSGDEVMFVPWACSFRDRALPINRRSWPEGVGLQAQLAWRLCQVRAAGDDAWRPYLDVLPSGFENHPLACDEAALQYLPEFAARVIGATRGKIETDYNLLCSEDPGAPSLKDFLWASCCVLSRGFREVEDRSCLMPICDLMNHSCQPNCAVQRSEGGLRVVALQDLAGGTALVWEYMVGASILMAAAYGFCPEDNPHDRVLIQGPIVTPELLQRVRAGSAPESAWRYWIAQVAATYDDPRTREVMGVIRSILRDPISRDPCGARPEILEGLAGSVPIDRAEELAALVELKAICDLSAMRIGRLTLLPDTASECERGMALLGSRIVQSNLRILDHLRRLCDHAMPLLRSDDGAAVRAGLADFPDEAYARELLEHADRLWPRAATATLLVGG